MIVTRLCCESCKSELTGKFRLNEFASLGGDDLALLRVFISARGSIKDVEAALGISYPTVRGRLERLIEKLGLGQGKREAMALSEEIGERRKEVLDQLAAGEITMEEAETLLGELRA